MDKNSKSECANFIGPSQRCNGICAWLWAWLRTWDYGPRLGFGIGVGVGIALSPYPSYHSPYYGNSYYASPYYARPYYPYNREVVVNTVYTSAPTTVYPERSYAVSSGPAQAISSASEPESGDTSSWYYCNNPDGFYPSIKACSSGWQRVAKQAPSDR